MFIRFVCTRLKQRAQKTISLQNICKIKDQFLFCELFKKSMRCILNQSFSYSPAVSIICHILLLLILYSVISHYIFIVSQLWLTSHPRIKVVLLDAGTPRTSREIYSEDTDDGTHTGNPSVIN